MLSIGKNKLASIFNNNNNMKLITFEYVFQIAYFKVNVDYNKLPSMG